MPPNPPPIADAGGPYYGLINEDIIFNASNSFAIEPKIIVLYEWDWNSDGIYDDHFLYIPTAVHSWTEEGIYTITLRVRDIKGATDTDTAVVTISAEEGKLIVKQGSTWNKYFKNGKSILESYGGPINYLVKSGSIEQWYHINIHIEEDILSDGVLNVNEAPYFLRILSDKSGYRFYPDRNNHDKWIDFYMPDIRVASILPDITIPFFEKQCTVTEDCIVWNFENFTIKIIPTNSMVSFQYILKNQDAQHSIGMEVIPHGCTINENGIIDGWESGIRLVNLINDSNVENSNIILPKFIYHTHNNILNITIDRQPEEKYPLTLDPTLTIYSSEYDSYITKTDGNYNTAHNAATGTSLSNVQTRCSVGQLKTFTHSIFRSYLYFNTTEVPDGAVISKGNVSLYGYIDASILNEFSITLQQNNTSERPLMPTVLGDYNYLYYWGDLGSFDTTPGFVTNAYNIIPLNASGRENISTYDWTKFCIRSSRDINSQPTPGFGNEYVSFWNGRATADKLPRLIVEFHAPEITNEFPPDGTIGVPLNMNYDWGSTHNISVNDSAGHRMWIDWFWWNDTLDDWELFGENNSVNNGTYRQDNSANYSYYNFDYYWRVSVNCTDVSGVIVNETYSFHINNSTVPVLSNILPANRTVDPQVTELSVTVNDAEGEMMRIIFYLSYGDCIGQTSTQWGYNGTYTHSVDPTTIPLGTVQWYVEVCDIQNWIYVDNIVISENFWFTNQYVWDDHFCNQNLVDDIQYSHNATPVKVVGDSFVEFHQYFNNSVSDGLHDTDVQVSIRNKDYFGPNQKFVFLNNSTGYAFATSTTINKIMLYKTTDGGLSWSLISDTEDGCYLGVWYEQWTVGSYGSNIYVINICLKTTYYYNINYSCFDTETDTFSSWTTIDYLKTPTIYTQPTICMDADEKLFVSAFGGSLLYSARGPHGVIYRSNDSGATWNDITPSPYFDGDYDYTQLLPLPANDIMCIYHDWSANNIMTTIYNHSNCSFGGFTTIGTSSKGLFSASLWKYTNDIYLAWQNDDVSAAGQVKFLQYNASNTTWWGVRTIDTNVFGYDATVIVSEGNGDIYVLYGNSTANLAPIMNISCSNSTDGGLTWSNPQRINTQAPSSFRYTTGNFMNMYKIYGGWYNSTLLAGWVLYGKNISTYQITNSYNETGNLSSIMITIPSYCIWHTFNVNYTTESNGINFEIRNETDVVLMSGLDGINNDVLALNGDGGENRTIYLYMNITNTSLVDWWNISVFVLITYVNPIDPYTVLTYPLNVTATGSCELDNVTLWYRYSPDNTSWDDTGYRIIRGVYEMGETSIIGNVTLPDEVDLNHAFVFCYPYMRQIDNDTSLGVVGAKGNYNSTLATSFLINSTTIQFERNSTKGVDGNDKPIFIDWQVFECFDDEFTVQRGELTVNGLNKNNTSVVIPNPVDANNTTAWHTMRTNFTHDITKPLTRCNQTQFISNVTDATTFNFTRWGTERIWATFRWITIEWDTSKINHTQKGDIYVGNNVYPATTADATLNPSINASNSLLLFQVAARDQNSASAAIAGFIRDSTTASFYCAKAGFGGVAANTDVHYTIIDFGNSTLNQTLWYDSNIAGWVGETYTITEVRPIRTFTFTSMAVTQTGFLPVPPHLSMHTCISNLTSSTEYELNRTLTGMIPVISWQILELLYDGGWIPYETDFSCPWQWNFTFPNGSGYYEFYSIGNWSNFTEDAPDEADAICYFNWGNIIGSVATILGSTETGTIVAFIGFALCMSNLFYLMCVRRKNNKCGVCNIRTKRKKRW